MDKFFGFLVGWFLAIFSTHYYGWKDTATVGLVLVGRYLFGLIMSKEVDK